MRDQLKGAIDDDDGEVFVDFDTKIPKKKKYSSSILGLFLLLSQHVSCSIFFCIKKIIMALSAT